MNLVFVFDLLHIANDWLQCKMWYLLSNRHCENLPFLSVLLQFSFCQKSNCLFNFKYLVYLLSTTFFFKAVNQSNVDNQEKKPNLEKIHLISFFFFFFLLLWFIMYEYMQLWKVILVISSNQNTCYWFLAYKIQQHFEYQNRKYFQQSHILLNYINF